MAEFKAGSYWEDTPVVFKKIGDSILFLSVGLIPIVHGLPLTDTQKLWIVSGLAAIGVIGKTITNFFTDTQTQNKA